MSREILFRGKQIDNEEWEVGGVFSSKDYTGIIVNAMRWVEVDPETVCQYAGLTDKNGKKIFENDKCCVGRPCVLTYGTIKYLEGCFCFVEDGTENILRLCDVRINGYEIKVDGNIFDNPELLEGE